MLSWFTTSRLRIALALAVVLTAGSVSARPVVKEFEQHVAAAQQSYAEKNYDKAIEEFEAAYQIDPEPVLLISIGRCHYRVWL